MKTPDLSSAADFIVVTRGLKPRPFKALYLRRGYIACGKNSGFDFVLKGRGFSRTASRKVNAGFSR
jgi:hypothetical protein